MRSLRRARGAGEVEAVGHAVLLDDLGVQSGVLLGALGLVEHAAEQVDDLITVSLLPISSWGCRCRRTRPRAGRDGTREPMVWPSMAVLEHLADLSSSTVISSGFSSL
jgi:hypothetical protein